MQFMVMIRYYVELYFREPGQETRLAHPRVPHQHHFEQIIVLVLSRSPALQQHCELYSHMSTCIITLLHGN